MWNPGVIQGCGVVEIQDRRISTSYMVMTIRTDWKGRAFIFAKVPGDEGTDSTEGRYSVFCGSGSEPHRCECKGFNRWGTNCKHIETALALIANEWI